MLEGVEGVEVQGRVRLDLGGHLRRQRRSRAPLKKSKCKDECEWSSKKCSHAARQPAAGRLSPRAPPSAAAEPAAAGGAGLQGRDVGQGASSAEEEGDGGAARVVPRQEVGVHAEEGQGQGHRPRHEEGPLAQQSREEVPEGLLPEEVRVHVRRGLRRPLDAARAAAGAAGAAVVAGGAPSSRRRRSAKRARTARGATSARASPPRSRRRRRRRRRRRPVRLRGHGQELRADQEEVRRGGQQRPRWLEKCKKKSFKKKCLLSCDKCPKESKPNKDGEEEEEAISRPNWGPPTSIRRRPRARAPTATTAAARTSTWASGRRRAACARRSRGGASAPRARTRGRCSSKGTRCASR